MMIALTAPQNNTDLELDIRIVTTLGISAQDAKRRVTRYFLDHVSMFIGPRDEPLLVVITPNEIVWRFRLFFTWGTLGALGEVGLIDVDAMTGELRITEQLITDITTHATQLASRPTYSTTK